jgi:hypothetical protein
MAVSSQQVPERRINELLASLFEKKSLLVLREMRLHPCEMDIVILDPVSLKLANIEIKRRDWQSLLRQTIRAQLYCHFAIAAMPSEMKANVPVTEFASRGIGVVFYACENETLRLDAVCNAEPSNSINRGFKRQIYQQFCSSFPEEVYA